MRYAAPLPAASGSLRPLRVLLTTDVVGGVWDFCWTLAAALTGRGHSVTLLAFGEPSATQRRQAQTAGAALVHAPLKLEWMRESAADVQRARAVALQVAQERQADLVHASQYALGSLALALPVVVTAHSDVLSWLAWVYHGDQPRPVPTEWRGYATTVRDGLRQATVVAGISRFMADEVRRHYGLDRPVEVVHNGWPGRATLSPLPLPLPLPRRSRLSLAAGRVWDEAKNLALVVAAARGWDSGRVLLAGEQRHPETGVQASVAHPVEALGSVERADLDRYLGQARVYLSPARYDPFGLLPLQAALAGCALLLADIPSYREVWGPDAQYFTPDDPSALRRAWAALLDDTPLAADLAARARRRALDRYDIQRVADDYLRLYAQVLPTAPTTGRGGTGGLDQPIPEAVPA